MSIQKEIFVGIVFGCIIGVIDVITMVIQGLTWDANLSAFFFWVVTGIVISTSRIKGNSVLKGVLISFLLLIPLSFLIGWHQPSSLIPILMMTLILGGLLGYSINRFSGK